MPPLTLCAYMKKGPNLRWSLIQCSGGDEGDRTPDLLTASQALSQLSYAPVRRSTIRELPRRCKDNFGKTFGGGAGDAGRARDRASPSLPAPAGRPPGTSRHGCGPSTTFGRHPPTMASRVKIKPQVDGLRFLRNTGYGRGAGAKRSRWAASVAATSRAAGPDAWRWTNKLICGQVMLSSSRNRPVFIHLAVADSCG